MKELKAKLKKQGGFTLIEMLAVVSIIVILVAVSIPVVNLNLERARDAADMANERAAKTLATMLYMGEIDYFTIPGVDPTSPMYIPGTPIEKWFNSEGQERGLFYDAQNGTLTYDKPINKGYGKCTGCGKIDYEGLSHKDCVILLEVDGNGVVTTHWVFEQDDAI